MLNVLDEFTHESLAIRVARKLKAIDVIDVLSDLFILRGMPGHIRSDNGPEFVAQTVQAWLQRSVRRLPTSHQAALGRTDTSRVLTHACATNYSMAKSSTRCARLKSSSRAGGATTTRSDRINRLVTNRQHLRCSYQPLLRGRLRYAGWLRRPSWRNEPH